MSEQIISEKMLEKNMKAYAVFQIFKEPLFIGPVLLFYAHEVIGMPWDKLFLMESVAMLTIAALQIPTGAFADKVGKRVAMNIGSFLFILEVIGFAFAAKPVHVWIANNLLWTLGFSLCSGADKALMINLFKKARANVGRQSELKTIEGNAQSWRYLASGISCLFAGILYKIHPQIPLILSIPGMVVAFVLTFSFSELVDKEDRNEKRKFDLLGHAIVMKNGLCELATKKQLLWVAIFAALMQGSSKVWFFSYPAYFTSAGISVEFFGVVFFVLNLVAWFFSRHAVKIESIIGERRSVLLMISCIGLPMVVMGAHVSILASMLVLAQNVFRGLEKPLLIPIETQYASDDLRTTIDSVKLALVSVAQFSSLTIFKIALKKYTLFSCLETTGWVVLVLGGVLYFWHMTIFQRGEVITPETVPKE